MRKNERDVVGRRCSALLVLRREGGWGFWVLRGALSALGLLVWGWEFFVGGLGFFCKFAEMYVFFEKEIFEIFLII